MECAIVEKLCLAIVVDQLYVQWVLGSGISGQHNKKIKHLSLSRIGTFMNIEISCDENHLNNPFF